MAIRYIEQDRTFWLDTEHTSYLLAIVDQENFVGHVYYGQRLILEILKSGVLLQVF